MCEREREKREFMYFIGCPSVQRIAAGIIPRYALFCPGSIDMASNVMIQILEWSEDVVLQGQDFDGVSFKTAEACLSGIVELSSAATTAASEVPEISDMSVAVCQNLAFYMLCRLAGRDLEKFALSESKRQVSVCLESSISAQEKIITLISINIVRLFHINPQSVFSACFELLGARNENQRKEGQNFLQQLMDGVTKNYDKEQCCDKQDKDGNCDDEQKNIMDSLLSQVYYHCGYMLYVCICNSLTSVDLTIIYIYMLVVSHTGT